MAVLEQELQNKEQVYGGFQLRLKVPFSIRKRIVMVALHRYSVWGKSFCMANGIFETQLKFAVHVYSGTS